MGEVVAVARMARGRRCEQLARLEMQLAYRWPVLTELPGVAEEAAQLISLEVVSGRSHLAEEEERTVVWARMMTVEVEGEQGVLQDSMFSES